MELAEGLPDVTIVLDPEGWLTVRGDQQALDTYAIALGRAGIAVRRLELVMSALESMFFLLTGERPEAPSDGSRQRVEAAG
jgi:hypothetical protein